MTYQQTGRWPQFLILLFASIQVTQASEVWVEPTKEQLAQYHAEMMNTLRGDVSISGIIQDTQGNDLHDVTLVTSVANESGGHSTTSIVSSHFSIMVTNCFSVGLTFMKDGYLSGERVFSVFNDLSPEGHGKTGITETGVVIRLHGEDETITYAMTYSGLVTFGDKGPERVLKMVDNPEEAFVNIESLSEITEQSTPNTLYLSCATNSQGKVILGQDGYPVDVRLVASGINSGFIKHNPSDSKRNRLKGMIMAPETGYSNSLSLNPWPEGRYIYLCTELAAGQKLYGKALIEATSISEDNGNVKVEVYIECLIQTNGSRNLYIH